MTLNKDAVRAPHVIFILYVLAACLVILVFRFIFPGIQAPLLLFSRNWRLVRGLVDVFDLFPALAFSALVIPFGLITFEEYHPSFSQIFFKHLLASVITAICAAVIYGFMFFFLLPMVKDYEENLRFKGELYHLAKEQALIRGRDREWDEAAQFLGICERVWPNSPDLASFKNEVIINLDKVRSLESQERSNALARERQGVSFLPLSGETAPVNATQAIGMAETAYKDQRYYDAHWLASLGERLAVRGSPDAANAARLAGLAWNKIESQEPSRREERLHSLYNTKRSGYLAMNSGDWIQAFYIFKELTALTPNDPDVGHFYAASEQGTRETAFFIDEMELSLGEILTGAVFSLPSQQGRAVLRFSSLSTSQDNGYGMGFEYMSFNEKSYPVVSLKSPYAKLLPFTMDGEPKVLVLMHALDRDNKNLSWNGEWLVGRKSDSGIILDVSFEDLLLLSQVRRGLFNLQIDELFATSKKMGDMGYVPQIFEAEILNRVGAAVFFLPMAIFVIVIGWRFRARTRPRYLFIPLFLVLPIIFHGFVFLYRAVLNTLGIWLVLSIGFSAALTVFIVVLAVSFFLFLILLAAQHG